MPKGGRRGAEGRNAKKSMNVKRKEFYCNGQTVARSTIQIFAHSFTLTRLLRAVGTCVLRV